MVQLMLIQLSTLPGVNFLLPATDGFAQLGVVLEGAAAQLQTVAGARHQQRQQPHQGHGDSTQGVGNFRRSQRCKN